MALPRNKRQTPPEASTSDISSKRPKIVIDEEDIIDLTLDNSPNDTSPKANPIQVIDDSEEEDEEMKDILAQIAAQEESEKLAKQLQAGTSTSCNGESSNRESDEEMARRLAAEWAANDAEIDSKESAGTNATEPIQPIQVHENGNTIPDGNDDFGSPPDHDLKPQDPLFTGERPCTKCGAMVPSPRGYVRCLVQGRRWTNSTLIISSLARPFFSCKGTPNSRSKNKVCAVNSCCAEGRAIAIFECLGGFDWQYLGEQETSATRVQTAAEARSSKADNSVGPGGTGYGTGGRGGSKPSRGPGSRTQKRAETLSKHWDQIVSRAFRILADLLPRQHADDAEVFDMLPHSSIGNLIALSCVPEYLVSLLRNDSVSEWCQRSEVYHAMLALLRRLAECELTIQVLVKPRWEQKKPGGITNWMWGEAEVVWNRDSDGHVEMGPPLFDHFRKLVKQCESFLAGAFQTDAAEGDEAGDEDTVEAASLCGDMIAVRDDLVRAMSILGIASDKSWKGKGKAKERGRSVEDEYRSACEKLAFKHTEFGNYAEGDGRLSNVYSYAADLANSQAATRVPKDRFHLIKELATMATSLPEGIFVRVDETRNDAIKAMIAGPPSTPYAGGLFEFDIFLPMTYPTAPPLVKLRTTGGGSVRFNPNLYNCGKVCLSLLGTWPGSADEQWKPRKSTLLQVLISIQSMILVEAPYFNEPGYGKVDLKNQSSINYNLNIQAQTTRWAIVDWMKDQHQIGMWADVIAAHFLVKKDEIRAQLNEWHSGNPNIKNYVSTPGHIHRGNWGGGSVQVMEGDGLSVKSAMATMKGKGPSKARPGNGIDLVQQFEDGLKAVEGWGLYP
ncbi:hypothetical protein AAF712_010069 [Marasmius tenuissimus]|uniref:UBC core domain-containing protein n=1 Tax=Marasmius tenuissimus TaxID=585030 RepID=A0ABR2ZN07_9AGAR